MPRHANPRVYIGPRTNEIVIPIGRAYGVGIGDGVVELTINLSKRSVNNPVVSTWISYAVVDGYVKFEIPTEFKSNAEDFPKGFYDGGVFIDECHVGDIELIKAPGRYLGPADSIEDKCHSEEEWVEPECSNELVSESSNCGCNCNGNPDTYCDCSYQVKNNCPTCYNQEIVAKVAVIEYAGIDEIDSEVCPVPDGTEEIELCDNTDGTCIGKPIAETAISEVQKTTQEGYIQDDNDC